MVCCHLFSPTVKEIHPKCGKNISTGISSRKAIRLSLVGGAQGLVLMIGSTVNCRGFQNHMNERIRPYSKIFQTSKIFIHFDTILIVATHERSEREYLNPPPFVSQWYWTDGSEIRPAPRDVWNPKKNGEKTTTINWLAGFLNHQQSESKGTNN